MNRKRLQPHRDSNNAEAAALEALACIAEHAEQAASKTPFQRRAALEDIAQFSRHAIQVLTQCANATPTNNDS